VLGHTGSIKKIDRASLPPKLLTRLVCLRLAALFCHGRIDEVPVALAVNGEAFVLAVDARWLAERPLDCLSAGC
jgi:hypothetical protein